MDHFRVESAVIKGNPCYFKHMVVALIVVITTASVYSAPTKTLVTPNASKEALSLISYLVDIYKVKIISGQHGEGNNWASYIKAVTGKSPAFRDYDLTYLSPCRGATGGGGVTQSAINWYSQSKGIMGMMWHWNAPKGGCDFYTTGTTFNLNTALTAGTEENTLLLRDMDTIASQLKKVRDANVPVIWRPFHEAAGAWFWWGAFGATSYKKLWNLMYDRYVNYHKLNNLIWVWTDQNNSSSLSWYPGDSVVDIIGRDSYRSAHDYDPIANEYTSIVNRFGDRKLVSLSETGTIPDPDKCVSQKAGWLSWSTWDGDQYVKDWNDSAMYKKTYAHDYVITLDELPDLKTYPTGTSGIERHSSAMARSVRLTESAGAYFDLSGRRLLGGHIKNNRPGVYLVREKKGSILSSRILLSSIR